TIFKFESGRLLVHEERTCETNYLASGQMIRIGFVRHIERVLSIDTDYSKLGLITNLEEVLISGNKLQVPMRYGGVSGDAGFGLLSGLTSGFRWRGPLVSGALTSGVIKVHANVIGY
ncbi:unnamed protein product, partial [marine sediment metagenome]